MTSESEVPQSSWKRLIRPLEPQEVGKWPLYCVTVGSWVRSLRLLNQNQQNITLFKSETFEDQSPGVIGNTEDTAVLSFQSLQSSRCSRLVVPAGLHYTDKTIRLSRRGVTISGHVAIGRLCRIETPHREVGMSWRIPRAQSYAGYHQVHALYLFPSHSRH